MINRIMIVSLAFVFSCLAIDAQEIDSPDLRASALAPSLADFPAGTKAHSRGVTYLHVSGRENYPAHSGGYTLETPRGQVALRIVCGVLDSPENAAEAFERFPSHIRESRVENQVGDRAFGEYPFRTVFVQDRVVCSVEFVPLKTFDLSGLEDRTALGQVLEPTYRDVMGAVVSRLDDQGYVKAGPLNVDADIRSDRVDPISSTEAEFVFASDSSELFPLRYEALVGELGSRLVLRSFPEIETSNGEARFVWNGEDSNGEIVDQGQYQLEILVTDNRRRLKHLRFPVTVLPKSQDFSSLPTTKDTTLRAQKPHRNEGANPRLFLSHRLEARGKSNNPLVGFSLADADLNGLTKATLVMNIQDCDLPRRWSRTGRDIEAHPVNASWVEGDGNKYRVNGGQGKTKGRGQGVTWFSPIDEKIQNNRPNGSQSWDGARSMATAPTAPPVTVMNDQTGPIEFDVTTDVLRTASLGDGYSEISWLLKKSDEGKFGNVRFYSKEGAAQAGDPELAPTLILEYGSPVSRTESHDNSPQASQLLSKVGIKSSLAKLKTRPGGSELPSLRQSLKQSAAMSQVCESTLSQLAGPNPALKIAARTAYRSWLHQTVTLG